MARPDPQHNAHRRTRHMEADRPAQRRSFLHPTASDDTPCWVPLGPSVVHEGGAHGTPPVSGRVVDVAVIPPAGGGEPRVYVATSNGGVWRSLDGGRRWSPRMEGLDLDPQGLGRHTLGCGALEVVPGATPEEDRLFLGTGEANSRDRYFGIGFLASDTGGNAPGAAISWREEEAYPPLDGFSCYTLARDPDDPEHLLAATTRGLYQRRADKTWHRVLEDTGGWFTDVVAATRPSGGRRFLAVTWGGRVHTSDDGTTWKPLGPKTPNPFTEDRHHDRPGRVGLAAGPGGMVYALVHNTVEDGILGVWRLESWDASATPPPWKRVFFHPEDLFGTRRPRQGDFDLALTVHPQDPNVLYLGGAALTIVPSYEYGAALYRCTVSLDSNRNWVMQPRMIGATVHPDVHALLPDPSHADGLWVGCDGGLFTCRDTTVDDPTFRPANTGLATLLTHHLAQHAKQGDVLLVGSQDNSCLLYTGSPAWHQMPPGDCGHVVLHPETFYRALRTVNGSKVQGARFATTRRAFSGAQHAHPESALQFAGYDASPARSRFWNESEDSWTRFYPPLVGGPTGETVAFGSCRPWISDDFGLSWYPLSEGQFELDHLGASVSALLLSSPDQLYAGTVEGKAFRYRRDANESQTWSRESLSHSDGAWNLPPGVPVTDFAPGADGDTVFVTFGGSEKPVWRHGTDGWTPIAGPQEGPEGLPRDVHYGAIARHPHGTLFVGSDIGVWRSEDGGATWHSFSHRLPDAPVFDLLLSPEGHRLRASTYGRGVFEVRLDEVLRGPHLEILSDPENRELLHPEPGIRIERADAEGAFSIDPLSDFQTLEAALASDSPRLLPFEELASRTLERDTQGTLLGRAFVEVFDRGPAPAQAVRVRGLLAPWPPSSDDPPPLPTEVAGKPLAQALMDDDPLPAPWRALESVAGDTTAELPVSIDALNPGFAAFELGPEPNGTQWILVAFAWCPEDPLEDLGETSMDPRNLGRQGAWRRMQLKSP